MGATSLLEISEMAAEVTQTPRQLAFEAAHLRMAGLKDVHALAELYRQARPEAEDTEETVEAWLEQGGALVLEHAEAGGRVVCALRWREVEDGWRLDRVATLNAFRGQNFGRWLMTKVEALAIQRNIPWLTIELDSDQDELLAYYGRMGYRPVDGDGRVLHKRVGGTWQYK